MSFDVPARACRHCLVGATGEDRCWNCDRTYTQSGVILAAGVVHFGPRDAETNYASQRAAAFEQHR